MELSPFIRCQPYKGHNKNEPNFIKILRLPS
jgi:hypothetical protein